MIFFKKLTSICLILALCLSLFGCNKENTPTPPEKVPAEEAPSEEIIEMPEIPVWEEPMAINPDNPDIVEEILGNITLTYLEKQALLVISGKGAIENILNNSKTSTAESPFFLLRDLEHHHLERVIIEEGITELNHCFNDLKGINRIYLPSTLKTINHSFTACNNLERIHIPEKVASIRSSFSKCQKLYKVYLFHAATIEENSFDECPLLSEIYIPSGSVLCNSFNYCTALKGIRMGGNVSCHDPSLEGCGKSFGGSTPASAFYIQEPLHAEKATALSAGISKLSSPLTGAKITILAEKEGEKPKAETLPGTLHTTFDEQSGTLTLSGEGQANDLYARTLLSKNHKGYETEPSTVDQKIKKIVVKEGITALFNCFNDLAALEEIILPESLSAIQLSFMGCTALKTLTIPKTCKEISIHSFNDCTALSSLRFEGAIKIAPWGGFSGLEALEELVIPEKSELCSAFSECKNLKKVTFQSEVKIHKAAVDERTPGAVSCYQSFKNLHEDCIFYLPKALYEQTAPRYEGDLVFTDYICDLLKDNHVITD